MKEGCESVKDQEWGIITGDEKSDEEGENLHEMEGYNTPVMKRGLRLHIYRVGGKMI